MSNLAKVYSSSGAPLHSLYFYTSFDETLIALSEPSGRLFIKGGHEGERGGGWRCPPDKSACAGSHCLVQPGSTRVPQFRVGTWQAPLSNRAVCTRPQTSLLPRLILHRCPCQDEPLGLASSSSPASPSSSRAGKQGDAWGLLSEQCGGPQMSFPRDTAEALGYSQAPDYSLGLGCSEGAEGCEWGGNTEYENGINVATPKVMRVPREQLVWRSCRPRPPFKILSGCAGFSQAG
ncbi:unnamed protein product [Pleuronectes platessa]|uniref:Uncharacterized protein n=1 Tax=Pleuronectes platessa TaxID=8262 RepID=A0A9N7TGQ7_PLEPL|nr:unnamed protein product [Pleuronectes platessa]